MTNVDVLDRLHAIPLLRRLPPSHLDRLASAAVEHRPEPGARILREGESGESVFLIVEGEIAISKRLPSGEETTVAIREAGDWIGEMALLDSGPRSASATARRAARVLEIPSGEFLAAVVSNPEATRELLRILSERLRESDRRHIESLEKKTEALAQINERLANENRRLSTAVEPRGVFAAFVGESAAADRVRSLARRAADSDLPVLLLGPTGTGKEILARAIHAASARSARQLVTLNCAQLTETLLESELFGHVRGAFTGAASVKQGLVEIADGGTLFLDEIVELPRGAQSALLRFLELGEYRRLGDTVTRRSDVRLLAATHADLETAVQEGRFRADLLYRIDVVRIEVPALRDRADDVPLLLAHVTNRVAERLRVPPLVFSPSARDALCRYPFPGNVRELVNEVERLHAVAPSGEPVGLADLSPKITQDDPGSASRYGDALRAFKLRLVSNALRESGGRRVDAARRLGVHPANLTRMMRELGLRDASPTRSTRGV